MERLLTGTRSGKLLVWEMESGTFQTALVRTQAIAKVAWFADGRRVLWAGGISAQQPKADGKLLLSGAGDSIARVWHLPSGKEVGRIRFAGGSTYVNSVGFSADGTLLMAAVDGRIVLAKVPRK